MAFTQVALTGTVNLSNATVAARASVTLTLNTPITDGTTIVAPEPLTVRCGPDGTFSITVNANDDPTTVPTGTYYTVVIGYGSETISTFDVIVPHAAAPTVGLFSLAQLPNPNVQSPFVTSVNGSNGAITNVVTASTPLLLPDTIQVFGHSYMAGAMTNPTTNRQTAKLAKACKGVESNHGVGSSILCSQQSVGGLDTSTSPATVVGVLQTVTANRTPGTDMFLSSVECAVLCWGINDWAMMGSTQFATSFPATLHTAIRRLRAGAIFEDSDSSVTYPTGSWTLGSGTTANSGAGNHSSTATSATVQIAVPSQYQGQAITIGGIDVGNAYTMTVTDEHSTNQGSLTFGGYGFTQTQRRNGYPSIYIPAGTLSSGSHTLTCTYSQAGATAMFFDYWSIESNPTPPILIELANRLPDYTKHASGWPHAPLNDAAITSMNTIMQTVANAYTDGHVFCVAVDDIIGDTAANLTVDGVHPNSGPAGQIAQRMFSTLQQANLGRTDLLMVGTA